MSTSRGAGKGAKLTVLKIYREIQSELSCPNTITRRIKSNIHELLNQGQPPRSKWNHSRGYLRISPLFATVHPNCIASAMGTN